MKREQRQVLLAQQGSSITRERERERESSSRLVLSPTSQITCHTERSEVSKNTRASNADAYVQNHLDISVSAKPQYDKAGGHNVISPSLASKRKPIISPSLAEGVWGWVSTL